MSLALFFDVHPSFSNKKRTQIPASVLKLLSAKSSTPSRFKVARYNVKEDVFRKEAIRTEPVLSFSRTSMRSGFGRKVALANSRESDASAGPVKTEDELRFPLSKIHLCADWTSEKVTQLRCSLKPEYFSYGSFLIREGCPVFHIFFLLSGDVSILRKIIASPEQGSGRSPTMNKISQSLIRYKGAGDGEDVSEVKIATACRGAVFGDAAAILGISATETVRVESRAGAMVWRLNVADLYQYVEPTELTRLQEMIKARASAKDNWSASQAMRQAETCAAVEDEHASHATYIDFPSRSELNAISLKLREELTRPLQWSRRKKLQATLQGSHDFSGWNNSSSTQSRAGLQRPQSASGRLTGNFQNFPAGGGSKGPHPLYGPSDYLGVGRMLSGQLGGRVREPNSGAQGLLGTLCHDGVQEHKYDVTRRHLFLSSWEMPGDHRVYMGSKVGSLVPSTKQVPHVEMDIDAIASLDGYLASY